MNAKRLLVACERSGIVRDAFAARGWDAWSCDTAPAENGGRHLQCDVREALSQHWDMMIAHPPCTYLSVSGLHWNGRRPGRSELTDSALAFVELLWRADIDRVCLENPVGCINSRLPFMPRPQYVQPYDFGDDASKKTGLWLRGLPKLIADPANRVFGRIAGHDRRGRPIERWANQTDSGQNRLGPSETRAIERARTYHGIAEAMAAQWST